MLPAYDLMPAEIAAIIPTLYAQEKLGMEAIVYVKYFTPDSNWTWYATEFDPEEGRFFGLVNGHDSELGYFMLSELQESKGLLGLHIERDLSWKPKPLSECIKSEVSGD